MGLRLADIVMISTANNTEQYLLTLTQFENRYKKAEISKNEQNETQATSDMKYDEIYMKSS